MLDPQGVWQSVEATMAGTCHIETTGRGPQNFPATYWRKTLSGDTRFHGFFVDALKRPGRTPEWHKAKRREIGSEQDWRTEYPMTWEDALFGGGIFLFDSTMLDLANEDTTGPQNATDGRKYIKAWDIGRVDDAAVGIVLDVTEDVCDVVSYERYRGLDYPHLQWRIEDTHAEYKGPTAIESNAAGLAVIENLNLPKDQVIAHNTSGPSKERMLKGLDIGFSNELLRYSADHYPQLDVELRGYQVPDDNVIQDSVIALAIAWDRAGEAHLSKGRIKRLLHW